MIRLLAALVLLVPSLAWGWTFTANMDSFPTIGSGWGACETTSAAEGDGYAESMTDSTTPDPAKVIHGHYRQLWDDGKEIFDCPLTLPVGTKEVYVQYYVKYATNWQWHSVTDKHIYFMHDNPASGVVRSPGVMIENRARSTGKTEMIIASASIFGEGYRYVNVPPATDIQKGTWYKINVYVKANTPGDYNGTVKVWVNDVLQLNYTNVPILASYSSYIYSVTLTPVWGGNVSDPAYVSPSGGMDQYFDKLIVSSEPIGDPTGPDTTAPYTSGHAPAKGATGQDNSAVISFHVLDAGDGVSQGTIAASIEGIQYTCASDEVVCSGTSADYTFTYTPVSTYGAGETVSVAIDACDAVGNCMATDSYTFQTTFQSTPTTTKTKAQLLEYLGGLSSQGSKKLLSGQRLSTMNTWVASDNTEWDEISALTGGTVPAVAGFDFSCGDTVEACDYADGIARVVTHWNSGGIPYFTHHAANPTTNEWSWPLGDPSFTFSNIYTPGNTQYDNYRIQLEKIGDAIALLADNNVVIAFAPFHEMNMNSDVFWWSYQSAANMKSAWEYVRNYLGFERGLDNNIIWVYAGYPWESDVTTYYSTIGDNNVDMIGIDYYSSNSRFNDSGIISRWNTLAASGKPMAVTELGLCSSSTHTDETCSNGDARTIVNDLSTYFPDAVWWMNWDDEDKDYGLNNMQYVPEALSDSRVIVLADNPSGGIASDTVEIQTTSLPTMRVGTAYSFSLTSVLGSTPYSYAVTAGTIPAGLVLSSSGSITGTPTTEGAYDFTVTVTDANTDTDDQQFTGTVLPKLPGGQVTTTSFTLTDTYVNSGGATTNYSDNAANRLYQWPLGTVANRTLVQVASLGLPDNISVTSATLYMYLSTWDGSGGTTPMNAYVYPVTGQSWTIANVTWNTLDNSAVGSYESVTAVPLTAGWYSWTVTEAVQAAYAGASALTLLIDGGNDGAADTNRYFVSMDGAEGSRPYLSVTYTLLTPGGVPVSAPGRFRVVNFKGSIR